MRHRGHVICKEEEGQFSAGETEDGLQKTDSEIQLNSGPGSVQGADPIVPEVLLYSSLLFGFSTIHFLFCLSYFELNWSISNKIFYPWFFILKYFIGSTVKEKPRQLIFGSFSYLTYSSFDY